MLRSQKYRNHRICRSEPVRRPSVAPAPLTTQSLSFGSLRHLASLAFLLSLGLCLLLLLWSLLFLRLPSVRCAFAEEAPPGGKPLPADGKPAPDDGKPAPAKESPPPPEGRNASLIALLDRLGIGPGRVVADIGCGTGNDSLVFAERVGPSGAVFAEEISQERIKDVLDNSRQKGHRQVTPILGEPRDPRLPDGSCDLIYMHFVFHHFADPRGMLRSFWLDLKPGGHLVIIDRAEGPLTDAVPLEKREKEHHWTGETAVVRMAREEGFAFADLLDDLWYEKDAFALHFRRPPDSKVPAGDSEPALPLDESKLASILPHALPQPAASAVPAGDVAAGGVAVFALDGGRAALPALRRAAGEATRVFDVVLEEWALAADEAPPAPEIQGLETLRTEKSDLKLPEGTVLGAVVFADSYHRIWDAALLLSRLSRSLSPLGRVTVLDRRGPDGEPRRLAGHRRRISPALVRDEMERAGLKLLEEVADAPAGDRFVLVFGRKAEGGPPASGAPAAGSERQF